MLDSPIVKGIILNYRDVTEKMKADESLRMANEKADENERKFKAILEQTSEGITVADFEGNYVLVNPAFCEMTAYSEEELLKMKIFDLLKSPQGVKIDPGLFGKPHEYILKRKDNSTFPTEIVIKPVKIGDDTLLLGMITNITERKKTEELIILQNAKLIHAKEKAEESDQLKSEFIHNMSHEIRTPLNSILGFSSILNEDDLSEKKQNQYIDIIQNSGNQLLTIIDDILEISKLSTKQVELSEKQICINDLFLELFSVFDLKAKENNTPLYVKKGLKDSQSKIYSDYSKLKIILIKLLENALKFTNTGFIEFGYNINQLQTDSESKSLQIYVKDTGIGIKPEKQETIFKRFSQEEKDLSKNVGGLGLGLSIAKENTELLGGKLSVRSIKGEGATFYVTIPYKPVQKNIDTMTSSYRINENMQQKQDNYSILIVEDEEINYLYLEILLENFNENLIVLHAKNGRDAVEICEENSSIDLVLMDLKMPIMNGFLATEKIKKFRPNLPIVAQTAYSTNDEKEHAIASGCNDFISKPIDQNEFEMILNKYLLIEE